MNYICKVLTPEFKIKVDTFLDEEVNHKMKSEAIKPDRVLEVRRPIIEEMHRIRFRSYLDNYWNGQTTDYPEIAEYYESVGMNNPQFEEVTLPKAEVCYQSQPRVEWNGNILKIDEIDEIFSFKRV